MSKSYFIITVYFFFFFKGFILFNLLCVSITYLEASFLKFFLFSLFTKLFSLIVSGYSKLKHDNIWFKCHLGCSVCFFFYFRFISLNRIKYLKIWSYIFSPPLYFVNTYLFQNNLPLYLILFFETFFWVFSIFFSWLLSSYFISLFLSYKILKWLLLWKPNSSKGIFSFKLSE